MNRLVEHLVIRTDDGLSLPVLVERPQPGPPRAVAILSHGLFSGKDEDGRFARLSAHLNRLGIATVRYDFRGHGEHATPLTELSVSGMVLDLHAVARWVKTGFADLPCHWVASSFGGAVSLLYLQTRYAVAPARLVLLNPVLDFGTTFLDPRSAVPASIFTPAKWTLAGQTGHLEVVPGAILGPIFLMELMLLRPGLTLGMRMPPTRIIHGTVDQSVSHDAAQALSKQVTGIDFQSVEGADHAFVEPRFEAAACQLVADWLD